MCPAGRHPLGSPTVWASRWPTGVGRPAAVTASTVRARMSRLTGAPGDRPRGHLAQVPPTSAHGSARTSSPASRTSAPPCRPWPGGGCAVIRVRATWTPRPPSGSGPPSTGSSSTARPPTGRAPRCPRPWCLPDGAPCTRCGPWCSGCGAPPRRCPAPTGASRSALVDDRQTLTWLLASLEVGGHASIAEPRVRNAVEAAAGDEVAARLLARFLRGDREVAPALSARLQVLP